MKLKLIDEWRQAHKFSSVRLSSLMAVALGVGPALLDAWHELPDDLKDALPHGWARWIATAGFVLVTLARMTRMEKADG